LFDPEPDPDQYKLVKDPDADPGGQKHTVRIQILNTCRLLIIAFCPLKSLLFRHLKVPKTLPVPIVKPVLDIGKYEKPYFACRYVGVTNFINEGLVLAFLPGTV
jgi:hypothetical protein